MTYCPSQAWDNYCGGQEMPEECPVCCQENVREDGEWVCPEAPGFCSKECQDHYAAYHKAHDDAQAAEYEQNKRG
jgi:hypothetical protein